MSRPQQHAAPDKRFGAALDEYYDANRSIAMQWGDRRPRHEAFARFALTFERLGDLSGQRGLDIGCGSGWYMAEALRRGAAHVVGLDPAPGMLEMAHRRMENLGGLGKITLVEGYFPQSVPPGTFDFVVVIGVLDYVADAAEFFQRLRPIVTGKAIVSLPSRHWFRTPLRKVRYRLRNCPVYFYNEQQICSIGRQAGFGTVDVIKIDGAGMDYHVCLAP